MYKNIFTLIFSFLFISTSVIAQEIPDYVPTDGLIGWYPFNGNANDESGNGNNGSVNGPNLTFDRFGTNNSAYDFDGGTEIITLSSPFASGVNEMTILVWFKPEFSSPTPNQVISVFQQDGPLDDGVSYLSYYPNSNLRYGFGTGNGNFNDVVTDYPSQEWHCAVMTYNGSSLKAYMDNSLLGSSSLTPAEYNSLAAFTIGNLDGNPVQGFIGTIDDIGIWNRALSEQEITGIFNACVSTLEPAITSNGSTTFCSGGFVQLTSSMADSYLWSNGATTQTITVTEAGEYTVTVFDSDGCSATSEPIEVFVNDVPSAAVNTSGSTDLCSGESVTLTVLGTGSYLWSNGATSQSIEVSDAGSYNVTVTSDGCSAISQPVEVTVTATPEAIVLPNGSTEFCEGGFVQLSAQGEGTFQWNTGATTQSITVSEPGNYSVIISNGGCSDISDPIGVTVNPLPVVSLTGLNDICENSQPVELSGGSPSGGWYTLNGETTNEINPSQTGPGMQSIGYSFTDGNGCSNSSNGTIMVNAVEPAEIFGLNSTYLPGDGSSELSAEPAGGVFGGAIVSGNIFDPNLAGPGTHSVSYAIVDENGCISLTGACTTVEIITGGQYGDDEAPGVRIYPNPASTIVTIEHPFQNARAEVINAVGQLVLLETLASSRGELVIGDLPMGIYQLRLIDQSGMMTNIPFVKK